MSYDTVENHYRTKFTLVQDHGWTWADIENMPPYERDIVLIMLRQWLDAQAEEAKKRAARQ